MLKNEKKEGNGIYVWKGVMIYKRKGEGRLWG